MSERDPHNVPPEDLPWNDAPADTDVVPGTEEPDLAEVEGDEGEEVDVSHRPSPDGWERYRRESLDERLAEEEPDRTLTAQDAEAGAIQAAEDDDEDLSLDLGEPDDDGGDDQSAEESAVHVRPEDRA